MRIRTALLCAFLVASPIRAQQPTAAPTADDVRNVIATVLLQEVSVRGPEGGAETCVGGELGSLPAAPGAEDDMIPDHAVRIRFQWHEPDRPAPVRAAPPERPAGSRRGRPPVMPPPPPPAALAADFAARLDALRAEAASAATPSPLARIDEALVPGPLRLQRPGDDCALITLSAPAFAGDAAFVSVGFACGTVCGNGGLYALQRREGRWELVGIADVWIR
jgi:hypothetical protein